MNIPNLFSIGNFAAIFRPKCAPGFKLYPGFRVSQFPPQDLEKSSTRISSVRLILCHEGCLLIRKNPSILLRMLFILFILFIFNGEYDNVAEYEKLTSEAKI